MRNVGAVFEGWNGYQTSIRHAVEPLTPEQLRWRPAPKVRSVGKLIRHLGLGRITWLARMGAPGIEVVCREVPGWYTDPDGARHVVEDSVPFDEGAVLTKWIELSWQPIQRMLEEWTIEQLFETYAHRFQGTLYTVSKQWTLWRIMSHDVHHGGQLAMMLACQDIPAFELRSLGGHIISPPVAS